jgi:hypothetical protein
MFVFVSFVIILQAMESPDDVPTIAELGRVCFLEAKGTSVRNTYPSLAYGASVLLQVRLFHSTTD